MSRLKISGINAGVAGEYFVAGELSKRGYIASITLRNTKGIDILASSADATKTVGIQVKTRQGKGRDWVLSEKAEDYHSSELFYVFVNLRGLEERPEFFVVPSKTVAAFIKNDHKQWLATPGRHGQKHNDTTMRRFHDEAEKFLEAWGLLDLDPKQ
ncbi:MAG: hypothetical protein AB1461_04630 [Thermodesulfobacteriota bacterium]